MTGSLVSREAVGPAERYVHHDWRPQFGPSSRGFRPVEGPFCNVLSTRQSRVPLKSVTLNRPIRPPLTIEQERTRPVPGAFEEVGTSTATFHLRSRAELEEIRPASVQHASALGGSSWGGLSPPSAPCSRPPHHQAVTHPRALLTANHIVGACSPTSPVDFAVFPARFARPTSLTS
jgi:hypothetical protein